MFLRGIYPSSITFKYPITAIAGPNCAGKSTLLALAACSFHNDTDFFPQNKIGQHYPYYTYRDFFVFAQDERGLTNNICIETEYYTRSHQTKKSSRKKKPSGKWYDYNQRPKRAVSFLGINRILPPSESQTHKNYRKSFSQQQLNQSDKDLLKNYMSIIFGKTYNDVNLYTHNKYRLFTVEKGIKYTGFNMGAGENAILYLLYEIISAGRGALIIVDEIELGLHITAQKKLINVLKELCKKFHCQIICSTHSPIILDSLPPCGRYLIQSVNQTTIYTPGITPEFAFQILANQAMPELTIFVEDEKARYMLEELLEADIKHRIAIHIIGSADNSIPQQMAACYREHRTDFCAVMDGDKRRNKDNIISNIVKTLSDRVEDSVEEKKLFFSERIEFLPGETNPEHYLLTETLEDNNLDERFPFWGYSNDRIREYCQNGIDAGTHNEFSTLSREMASDENTIYRDVVRNYKITHSNEVASLNKFITDCLDR